MLAGVCELDNGGRAGHGHLPAEAGDCFLVRPGNPGNGTCQFGTQSSKLFLQRLYFFVAKTVIIFVKTVTFFAKTTTHSAGPVTQSALY